MGEEVAFSYVFEGSELIENLTGAIHKRRRQIKGRG